MRQGYTLMWSGGQGDLIDRGDNEVAYLPFAQKEGKPLRGQDVQPYPGVDRSTAMLTMREYESDPRVLRAIQSGATQAIAVTIVRWTGPALQIPVLPWTLIKDATTAMPLPPRLRPRRASSSVAGPRSVASSTMPYR